MKRALLLVLVPSTVIAGVLVGALAGCSHRRNSLRGDWAPAYETNAGGAPSAPSAPSAPAAADAGSKTLLDTASKAATVEGEKRAVLLESELTAARNAMKDANIDAAREAYGRALELDPQNAEAREGWKNLNTDRPSTVKDYFDKTRREEAVRKEQAAAEVRAYVTRGRALEAQEDYNGAIKEYQSAVAIVSWYSNQDGFGVTSDSLRDVIDGVREKAAGKDRAVKTEALRKAQSAREGELVQERQERLGRIRAFFSQADLAYHRGEYATAREYSRAVLREDPTNADANRLIDISNESEHVATQDANRRAFDEEWKEVFASLEEAVLPQTDVVKFPDNWLSEVVHRKPRSVGESEQAVDSEGSAAILATLDSKRVKGLQWEDQNLDQVVAYLRTVTGLNFFITPKVRSSSFDTVKVTLGPLDDVSVRQIMDLVTAPFDLRWQAKAGIVQIAAKDEVGGTVRLRYFDVRDLAVKIENHRGDDLYLAPSNFTPPEPPELPEPAPIFPVDSLAETIKATIEPGSWEVEGAGIDVKNNILIARNTTENLDQVQRLLEDLRTNSGPLVSIEVRFITVEDNFLRDVGVDVRGLGDNSQGTGVPGKGASHPQDDVFFGTTSGANTEPASVGRDNSSGIFYNDGQDGAYSGRVENIFDQLLGNPNVLTGTGGLSFQHTFLDDIQMEVILRAVEKSERSEKVTGTKLTVFNTQRATVQVLTQVAYVGDYDVEIAQASNIANPQIRYVKEGTVLDVKPVVSADRRFITLELRPTVATLVRPIPTFSTSLASGPIGTNTPVIIQVPKLQKNSVRTTVTMPDGGTLLLGGLKFFDEVDATSEVPLISKIPILSFLFSRKGRYVNRRNLICLITAQIVALEEMEPRGEYRPPPIPDTRWTPVRDIPECPTPCDPCKK